VFLFPRGARRRAGREERGEKKIEREKELRDDTTQYSPARLGHLIGPRDDQSDETREAIVSRRNHPLSSDGSYDFLADLHYPERRESEER